MSNHDDDYRPETLVIWILLSLLAWALIIAHYVNTASGVSQ